MIDIFQSEKDDGVDKLVKNSQSIAYCTPILSSEKFDVPEGLPKLAYSTAGHNDVCLHYLKTILVTAGTSNKNDDYFDCGEVWEARKTPEDTPFNLHHDCDQIIGHIIGSSVVNEKGDEIPDDSTLTSLPAKFHVTASTVLYKLWSKPDMQEKMDTVIAEIIKGDKWFVSMECYFKGFDYAMVSEGKVEIINRNEKTAFLTKHLRCYGGSGVYQNKKISRVLRNITFSGKGLVENPANPESVILPSVASLVYETLTGNIKGDDDVSVEIEALNKQVETLKAENERLETEAKANVKQFETVQVEFKEKIDGLTQQIATLSNDNKSLATKVEEKTTEFQAVSEELNNIKVAQKKAKRLVSLQAALKVDGTDVEAVKASEQLNDSLAVISDEAFESFVLAQAKFTPAPLPAQSAVKTVTDVAVLETAVPEKEVSLASKTVDEGAENTRIQLASLFTKEIKDK